MISALSVLAAQASLARTPPRLTVGSRRNGLSIIGGRAEKDSFGSRRHILDRLIYSCFGPGPQRHIAAAENTLRKRNRASALAWYLRMVGR